MGLNTLNTKEWSFIHIILVFSTWRPGMSFVLCNADGHADIYYVMVYEVCFFQNPMGYKKKTNLHNIIILLPKVQQGLTYFST